MQLIRGEIERLAIEVANLPKLRQSWYTRIAHHESVRLAHVQRAKHATASLELEQASEAPQQNPYVAQLKQAAANLQAAFGRQTRAAVREAASQKRSNAKSFELGHNDDLPYVAEAGHEVTAEMESVARRFQQVRAGLFCASVRLENEAGPAAQDVATNVSQAGTVRSESLERLVRDGRAKDALQVFSRLCKEARAKADDYHLIMGLVDVATAEKLYNRMARQGLRPTAGSLHIIVSKYARDGRVDDVARVIQAHQSQHGEPQPATYEVLLKLLGKDRNPLGLLEDIDRLGLRLDAALAKVLAQECAVLLDGLGVRAMYARVVENGLGHTVDAVRLLAMAAVATNQMDIVQSVVASLENFADDNDREYMFQTLAKALGMHGDAEDVHWLEARMDESVGQWSAGMYGELAGAYAATGRSGDMVRVIRRCGMRQPEHLKLVCVVAARECAHAGDPSSLGDVLATMQECKVPFNRGMLKVIVQGLSLVGEVEAMESFLAYAKTKRILISPAVEDLKQHAYNVKWWIDSVDKQRAIGDHEAAQLAVLRMYRLASLSALEIYAHRRDFDGVTLIVNALRERGADLHPSTRARVVRAFRDQPEADQVKEVLALLPVSRTLSDVQAKEKFLAELTPGRA